MKDTKIVLDEKFNEEYLIKISGLYKNFDKVKVLKGVSLNIKKGEKVVILGPSGSGKSTMLRCMNLLETPTYGEIWFEGKLLTPVDPYLHRKIMRSSNTYKSLYEKYKTEFPDLDEDGLDGKIISEIKEKDLLQKREGKEY